MKPLPTLNRLQHEKSPYLLQHKNNPVDWYPWGDEAFAKAKEENKPIFLSIGYATCHWCHVMEHESFEDEGIAELMNQAFINIKVDREERPDIDSTYMTVCQMLNGHGGWPLSIIMTPDKEPFFAGTYIPKEARFNRIGLRQLIPGITGMWKHEPAKVQKAVEGIKDGFQRSQEFEQGLFPGLESVDYAAEQLAARYDDQHGGFGSAPKFPSPHNLSFLLRKWYTTKEERFKNAVEHTLTQMRLGGIWDHIGYGFHRYSTDQEWLLPHFEKMLYDQALLMLAYTEGWQVSNTPLFKQTIVELDQYITNKLTSEKGAFFSAEDADSEGEEGKFYVWSLSEIQEVLSKEDAAFFTEYYQILEKGNFEDEATKVKTGANIPHLKTTLNESNQVRFNDIREQLYEIREKRIKPLLDDKILCDWNGMMIMAYAKAGAVLQEPMFVEKAKKAYAFILNNLYVENQLFHRYKEGEHAINAFADDYAMLVWASIELYEATYDEQYLEKAILLQNQMIELFWDSEQGGFYLTDTKTEELLGRQKQIYDAAVPSSNSVAMQNLMKLSRLTGDSKFEEFAQKIGECFSTDLIRSGSSITLGLQAIQYAHASTNEIVISSEKALDFDNELLKILRSGFNPFKISIAKSTENKSLSTLAPFSSNMHPVDGKTTIYYCSNYSCDKPFYTAKELREKLYAE